MPTIKRQLWICLAVYALSLVHLGGCATHTPPRPLDVGQVVVAPPVKLPAPPVVVQQTLAFPVGYFQRTLADYFSGSSDRPTTSTSPTPVAARTPTQ